MGVRALLGFPRAIHAESPGFSAAKTEAILRQTLAQNLEPPARAQVEPSLRVALPH